MATQIPKETRGWQLRGIGKEAGWDSLHWSPAIPIPELGPTDVLVQFHAVSLNYRDIAIVRGTYPSPVNEGVTPGSDGAGQVLAVGNRVTRFRHGDRVIAYQWQTGYFAGTTPQPEALASILGGSLDGTFREHRVFDQQGLVSMPSSLTYEEAAAVQGSWLPAWNCLMGGRTPLRVGDCVLVQGSGAVSVAAVQIGVAAGATVIATSSSSTKLEKLKVLGAGQVINYTEDLEWGVTAKRLSPGGRGCTHVIEVAGDPKSFRQDLECIAVGGEIAVVGFLGAGATAAGEAAPGFLDTLMKGCSVRGIQSGSREQLEAVCLAIEALGLKPVVDDYVCELKDVKEAYQYLADQKHFGKVVVSIQG